MKKFLIVLIMTVAALSFSGCGEDDTKADLRWVNKYGNTVSEIVWINDAKENQRWSGSVTNTQLTSYKGITRLNGSGECLFTGGSGVPQPIILVDTDPAVAGLEINGTSSVVVTKNASATLVIGSIGK